MKSDHDRNGPQYPAVKVQINRAEAQRLSDALDRIIEAHDRGDLDLTEGERDDLTELEFLLYEYNTKFI
jgi:hypothetical protein